MKAERIYERVTLTKPIDEASFCAYFNDTIRELLSRYGRGYVLLPRAVFDGIEYATDPCEIFPEYESCIADNILFLAGADDKYKTDFVNKAEYSYLAVWRRTSHGRKLRKERW